MEGRSSSSRASETSADLSPRSAYVRAVHLWRAVVGAVEGTSTPKKPLPCSGTNAEGLHRLEANAKQRDVLTLPCGLQYMPLSEATMGAKSPKRNSECEVHYRAWVLDGTPDEYDSTYKRNKPVKITPDGVVQGWTIALQLMGQGDKWRLWLPAELAYGDAGRSDQTGDIVPPGAALMFELELLRVLGPAKPKPRRPPDPPSEGDYVRALTFQGRLPGYIFSTRDAITGYCALAEGAMHLRHVHLSSVHACVVRIYAWHRLQGFD